MKIEFYVCCQCKDYFESDTIITLKHGGIEGDMYYCKNCWRKHIKSSIEEDKEHDRINDKNL